MSERCLVGADREHQVETVPPARRRCLSRPRPGGGAICVRHAVDVIGPAPPRFRRSDPSVGRTTSSAPAVEPGASTSAAMISCEVGASAVVARPAETRDVGDRGDLRRRKSASLAMQNRRVSGIPPRPPTIARAVACFFAPRQETMATRSLALVEWPWQWRELWARRMTSDLCGIRRRESAPHDRTSSRSGDLARAGVFSWPSVASSGVRTPHQVAVGAAAIGAHARRPSSRQDAGTSEVKTARGHAGGDAGQQADARGQAPIATAPRATGIDGTASKSGSGASTGLRSLEHRRPTRQAPRPAADAEDEQSGSTRAGPVDPEAPLGSASQRATPIPRAARWRRNATSFPSAGRRTDQGTSRR